MKKQQKTLVSFILDKSGSMQSVRAATISGFNEYINTLKTDKENKYKLALTLFSTDSKRSKTKDIQEVDELTLESYVPSGNTALYDAVCSTIKNIEEEDGQDVIVVIMTDGEENSSKEYTEKEMKIYIEEREKRGNYKFVYLGANQDAYAVAQKFGIAKADTACFYASSAGLSQSMGTTAKGTINYASSRATGASSATDFFTKKDQDDLANTK